ncbi:MAG: hypothetical protein WHX93_05120 [bacterium]
MRAAATAVDRWMNEHHERMMVCPNQPGALLLTKRACMRRYLASQEETYEDMMLVDFFRYRVKKGLYLCKNCPVGASLASARACEYGERIQQENHRAMAQGF